MATQYEVEHGIKPTSKPRTRRQIDMSTFTARLHEISNDPSAPALSSPLEPGAPQTSLPRNNPHATPNPVDMSALVRLLQDQLGTLASDAPDADNRNFLMSLFEGLEEDVLDPPRQVEGVSQEFLDQLERIPKKTIQSGKFKDETCPICAERFSDDPYPLVVELQCHKSHHFDLECVAPWLQLKGTCPLCRMDLRQFDPRRRTGVSDKIKDLHKEGKDGEKEREKVVEEEEDDPDMLYG